MGIIGKLDEYDYRLAAEQRSTHLLIIEIPMSSSVDVDIYEVANILDNSDVIFLDNVYYTCNHYFIDTTTDSENGMNTIMTIMLERGESKNEMFR